MSKYVSSPFLRWKTSDYWDQPLHVLMGVWPASIASIFCDSLGLLLVITLGNLFYLANREYLQHLAKTPPSPVFINVDLCFGYGGVVLGVVVFLLN